MQTIHIWTRYRYHPAELDLNYCCIVTDAISYRVAFFKRFLGNVITNWQKDMWRQNLGGLHLYSSLSLVLLDLKKIHFKRSSKKWVSSDPERDLNHFFPTKAPGCLNGSIKVKSIQKGQYFKVLNLYSIYLQFSLI